MIIGGEFYSENRAVKYIITETKLTFDGAAWLTELDVAKRDAKAAIDEYKATFVEADYYADEWASFDTIIEEGKALEKPIFADGTLGRLAKKLKPLEDYYDVVLHGTEYGLEYFGENMDVETLCAIIAQRKDYEKGTKIRLVSCDTGAEEDGVAKYVADKLRVDVLAPTKKAIVAMQLNGEIETYSGSRIGKRDGEYKLFKPDSEVKNK